MTASVETIRVAANGLDFEVDQMGAGDKLALLLHGFPESKFSWRAQLPVFAERDYTVWAPNTRGYGNTTRPIGKAAYTVDHLLADAAGLIDAARARGITGPVTLVAHDWGGIVAWTFAIERVRPLERFIILNIPHPALMGKGLRSFRQLRKSWYMFFFQIPWLPEWLLGLRKAEAIGRAFRDMAVDKSRFPDAVVDEYRRNALKPGALTAMLNYYRANIFNAKNRKRWTDTPQLDTPTLMIWGEEDTALGKELTTDTHTLVSDLTLRYLPRVSHWVQQEAPETVNAMIEAWLDGRPVPQAGEVAALVHTGEAGAAATS